MSAGDAVAGSMSEHLDERLRRKLVNRRGQLHAFTSVVPRQIAFVVIDMVVAFVRSVPGTPALVAPINRLAAAARAGGGVVAWVHPTPPSTWPSHVATRALFGPAAMDEYDAGLRESGPEACLAADLDVQAEDWSVRKTGHSAFFPGNSDLPERLRARGADTVVIAGVLTDVCVAASARDAHESGFKVLVCADGVAANEVALHLASLRSLARVYADVRNADELVELVAAGALTPAPARSLRRR